jgi:hypothetical protein
VRNSYILRIDSEPITLLVEPSAERLFAHKGLLTSSSGFFTKALSEDWKEGAERTVKLPEACPTACRIYTKWLYTGRISSSPAEKGTFDKELYKMLDCYRLSDYLRDMNFLDAVIDGLAEGSVENARIPLILARTVYPLTTKDSPHRKFCRDVLVHSLNRREFSALHKKDLPHEFFVDLLVDIASQLAKGIPDLDLDVFLKSKGDCEYHEHVRLDQPCYKLGFDL